jgi:hypothetical protein
MGRGHDSRRDTRRGSNMRTARSPPEQPGHPTHHTRTNVNRADSHQRTLLSPYPQSEAVALLICTLNMRKLLPHTGLPLYGIVMASLIHNAFIREDMNRRSIANGGFPEGCGTNAANGNSGTNPGIASEHTNAGLKTHRGDWNQWWRPKYSRFYWPADFNRWRIASKIGRSDLAAARLRVYKKG